jgi:7-carboxy-7-deazaguanine synthase
MRGTNPIRPPKTDDGQTLDVQEIFLTLQGEGPNAGTPAVFVRLGGCNLACDFCDTQFESFSAMPLGSVIDRIQDLGFRIQEKNFLIVITGGEPLRQNIVPLCEALVTRGFRVQIETNGTLYRPLPEAVEIVCSPKNTGNGYASIRPDLLPRIAAFKYLVSASQPLYGEVPAAVGVPIYVQPMDEYDPAKNAANVELAKQLALTHGYKLSIQLHKLLGIP